MSDAQQITLLVDGEETKVTTGTTGAELFFERRDVVVARVNGELKDLDQELPEGADVEGVTIDDFDKVDLDGVLGDVLLVVIVLGDRRRGRDQHEDEEGQYYEQAGGVLHEYVPGT